MKANHFYGKRRPEIKRGLLSPYDTSIEDFCGLSLNVLRLAVLNIQQEDGTFVEGSILDIQFYEEQHCFLLSYLIKDKRYSKALTHNNLVINKLPNQVLAILYTDKFITEQFAHAGPSIVQSLKANMEKYRFNVDKTKRTLKAIHDISLHTLRPFTVDCPHADMNEAMDEIACHMHNHFFPGDILIHRSACSHVQALLVKENDKAAKTITVYYPKDDYSAIIKLPMDGQIVGYYSSDRFAHGDIQTAIDAFKADVAADKYSDKGEASSLSLFLEFKGVVEFYMGINGDLVL